MGAPQAAARDVMASAAPFWSSGPTTMSGCRAARTCAARVSMPASPRTRIPVIDRVWPDRTSPDSGASGPSGSNDARNGRFRCTGPAGASVAVATARPTTSLTSASGPGPVSGTGSSAYHLQARPYRCAWSMVWAAPRSRSSGGRSAVNTMSGTRPWNASTTAGAKLTTAVPDVPRMTTGRRPALARPSAKNAAARSSTWVRTRMSGCARSARAMGIDRDPGQTMASRTPAATREPTKTLSGAAGVM